MLVEEETKLGKTRPGQSQSIMSERSGRRRVWKCSVVIANLVLEVLVLIPGSDRNPFSTLKHPVLIPDPDEESI